MKRIFMTAGILLLIVIFVSCSKLNGSAETDMPNDYAEPTKATATIVPDATEAVEQEPLK